MKTYVLENDYLRVEFIARGATIVSIQYKGFDHNLIISYQDREQFLNNSNYCLGSTIGPSAGRIQHGQFMMDDKLYQLSLNGAHHLHGGNTALQLHDLDVSKNGDSLIFTKTIDHRPDGYPGSVAYEVIYKLVSDRIEMSCLARPDTKMPLNMTNHMYFNLDGSASVMNHALTIDSQHMILLNDDGSPSDKLLKVDGTIFDFNEGKVLTVLEAGHEQYEISRFLDHGFMLGDHRTVTLSGKEVQLEIKTDGQSVVAYASNYFDDGFVTDQGHVAHNQIGLALETQNAPNGVNTGLDPNPFYTPERPFTLNTTYKFTQTNK